MRSHFVQRHGSQNPPIDSVSTFSSWWKSSCDIDFLCCFRFKSVVMTHWQKYFRSDILFSHSGIRVDIMLLHCSCIPNLDSPTGHSLYLWSWFYSIRATLPQRWRQPTAGTSGTRGARSVEGWGVLAALASGSRGAGMSGGWQQR